MKKNRIIIKITIVFIILGLAGYAIYDKYFKEDHVIETETIRNKFPKNEQEIKELGKELFELTSINYYKIHYYFYADKILNDEKSMIAFENIPDSLYEYNKKYQNYTTDEIIDKCWNENSQDYSKCQTRKVSKDIFEKYYASIFGKEKIDYTNFLLSTSREYCKIEKNNIVCSTYPGGETYNLYSYLKHIETELYNNKLYVFSKMLTLVKYDAVYSEQTKTTKIDDSDYADKIFEKENFEELLFEKYESQATEYKLTFEQNEEGYWYWVSTELIK